MPRRSDKAEATFSLSSFLPKIIMLDSNYRERNKRVGLVGNRGDKVELEKNGLYTHREKDRYINI